MFIVDANVLITASRLYYEFGRVDEYWEWLLYQNEIHNVKVPLEVIVEVETGKDKLSEWVSSFKETLILNESVDKLLLEQVYQEGYERGLSRTERTVIGADAYLISYALTQLDIRTVVTLERKNNKVRQNRSIPSVCEDLGVNCCDPFEFGRRLNFSTNWKDNL